MTSRWPLNAGFLACTALFVSIYPLAHAKADQIVLKSGKELRLIVDTTDQVIALGKSNAGAKTFEFSSRSDAGVIDFFSVRVSDRGQNWSFVLDSKRLGKLQCSGAGPKGDPFVMGSCDDGKLFVLLPALPGQRNTESVRIDRNRMRAITRNLEVRLPTESNEGDKANVDLLFRPGDDWLYDLIASQQSTIGVMFTNNAQRELEAGIIPPECKDEPRCRVMLYQSIIEDAARASATQ